MSDDVLGQPSGANLDQVVAEVNVLRLQEGDVLILKSPSVMKDGDFRYVLNAQKKISEHVGFKVLLLAVPGDATFEVLRSALLTNPAYREEAVAVLGDPPPPAPLPMKPAGALDFPILKSRKPGPLSGIIAEAAAAHEYDNNEDRGNE